MGSIVPLFGSAEALRRIVVQRYEGAMYGGLNPDPELAEGEGALQDEKETN
jgi:hypothetical protein